MIIKINLSQLITIAIQNSTQCLQMKLKCNSQISPQTVHNSKKEKKEDNQYCNRLKSLCQCIKMPLSRVTAVRLGVVVEFKTSSATSNDTAVSLSPVTMVTEIGRVTTSVPWSSTALPLSVCAGKARSRGGVGW